MDSSSNMPHYFISAILLCLVNFLASGSQAVCSSLQHGPYCSFVNHLKLPINHDESFTFKGLSSGGLTIIDADSLSEHSPSEVVEKLVTKFVKQLEAQNRGQQAKPMPEPSKAEGMFMLRGSAHLQRNFVWLKPVRWLNKPGDTWVMVSVFGGMSESPSVGHHYTEITLKPLRYTAPMLVLSLGDADHGAILQQCSKLVLTRARRGIRKHFLEGTWSGTYACMGSRTFAKLVVTTTRTEEESHVTARLSFEAELFPGRESTSSGCKCLFKWGYAGKTFTQGQCGYTDSSERLWCFIESGTCSRPPAGINWDYCPERLKEKEKEQYKVLFSFDQNGDFIPL